MKPSAPTQLPQVTQGGADFHRTEFDAVQRIHVAHGLLVGHAILRSVYGDLPTQRTVIAPSLTRPEGK